MAIQIKRGLTASWEDTTKGKLLPGQLGLEKTSSGSLRLKAGFGTEEALWGDLPYTAPNPDIYKDDMISPDSLNTFLSWNSSLKTATCNYDMTAKSLKIDSTSAGLLNVSTVRNIIAIEEDSSLPDPADCGPEGSLLVVYEKEQVATTNTLLNTVPVENNTAEPTENRNTEETTTENTTEGTTSNEGEVS